MKEQTMKELDMSNEQALREYEREQDKQHEEFQRLYDERRQSFADQLRTNYGYFCAEFEDRMASQLFISEPFVKAIWELSTAPSNQRLAEVGEHFEILILSMADNLMDEEIEAGWPND